MVMTYSKPWDIERWVITEYWAIDKWPIIFQQFFQMFLFLKLLYVYQFLPNAIRLKQIKNKFTQIQLLSAKPSV